MKFKKFFFHAWGIAIIVIVSVLMSIWVISFRTNPEQKEEKEQTYVPQISIDSLSTLGIDVTLWTESQQSFEKLNDAIAERVSLSTHSFVGSTSGLVGEFDWSVAKQYLKWQGNKTELFTNYGNRFVVFGNYVTLQDKLIFSGYLYKY